MADFTGWQVSIKKDYTRDTQAYLAGLDEWEKDFESDGTIESENWTDVEGDVIVARIPERDGETFAREDVEHKVGIWYPEADLSMFRIEHLTMQGNDLGELVRETVWSKLSRIMVHDGAELQYAKADRYDDDYEDGWGWTYADETETAAFLDHKACDITESQDWPHIDDYADGRDGVDLLVGFSDGTHWRVKGWSIGDLLLSGTGIQPVND